ncbi:MAG: sugar phosphate nucleotidyltransferase [Candidatus Omnitrophota bacterium]
MPNSTLDIGLDNCKVTNLAGIILAAGEGTRMKSAMPKVLHKVCGEPMLKYTLDSLRKLGVKDNIVVTGYKAEELEAWLKSQGKGLKPVRQLKLLGSGDAVRQARRSLAKFKGDVLVLYGDTPLIGYDSLEKLVNLHQKSNAACTLLTAVLKNPTGFGRILRGEDNKIVKIVEEQDADHYEKAIDEINVGAYCFKSADLFSALEELTPDNMKKEYYLTDVVAALNRGKALVESVAADNEEEAWGINSRSDLARANAVINKRRQEHLIANGVTIIDPATTYIFGEIEAGSDTVIYPHTVIEGGVKIGRSCQIGPFAHLRSGAVLEDSVKIGNFVEIVRAKIGAGSKIKHHSYIGDTLMGKNVNVGAGAITANYDGKNKNTTIIEDNAFIGVGAVLIAPVKIGKGALVGAGSVVTKGKDVPAGKIVAGVPAAVLKKRRGEVTSPLQRKRGH